MDAPLGYEIDLATRCIHVTYRCQPTFDEWSQAMNAIFADARRESNFGILLDRLRILHPASTDYIRRMVAFIDSKNAGLGRIPWAIVVADIASFGMGRMAEQMAQSESIRTFRDLPSAHEWLERFGDS